jgi:8-amino-7-oxononanoate synthase
MLDGAHSLNFNQQPAVSIKMGTLSKAGGSYGGYVCGSKILIEYLKTAARSLIFSTGLPPATLAASVEAIKIMQNQPELAQKSLANAELFTEILGLKRAQSSIVPLILEENARAISASNMLAEKGFLVSAIRPPTVPENTARLRFTFSALHTKKMVEELAFVVQSQIK